MQRVGRGRVGEALSDLAAPCPARTVSGGL